MNIVLIEPLSVSRPVVDGFREKFEKAGHNFISYKDRVEDPDVLAERGKDADIIVLTNLPFGRSVIEKCKNLKMISVGFTGVDHIDLEACRKQGITVSNSAGYSTDSVAELVIGHILMKLRNLNECDKAVREGKTKEGLVGTTLKGKTLGIVGTGAIGIRVAEIASAFGCRLTGWSRSKREDALKAGIEYVSLEKLFSESDIISLHLPFNEKTENLVGSELVSKMKKTAILVNAARGGVVDSNALAEALNSGRIGGACIDVFETEPPIKSDHPLINTPDTILSPHVAFATDQSFLIRADVVFGNIFSWLDGKTVNRVI